MSEFEKLVQLLLDEADEAAKRGIGVSIVLTHPSGLEERILRPARLRQPILTPSLRRALEALRSRSTTEAAMELGVTESAIGMARWRAAMRLGLSNLSDLTPLLISEAERLGEIPPIDRA